jgi:hypothetical protein
MMTPTARSMTFPRAAKSRNSFNILTPLVRKTSDELSDGD